MPAACSCSPPACRPRPRLGSVVPWWIPSATAPRGALAGRCRSARLIRSISVLTAGWLRAVNLWMGFRAPVLGPGRVPAVVQQPGAMPAVPAWRVSAAGWKIGLIGCSRTRTTGGSPGSRNGWPAARLAGPPPGPRAGRSGPHPGRIRRPDRQPIAGVSSHQRRPAPEPAPAGPWRRCRGGRAVARTLRPGTGLIRRISRCPVGSGRSARLHHRPARARRPGRGRSRMPCPSLGRMAVAAVDDPCPGPAAGSVASDRRGVAAAAVAVGAGVARQAGSPALRFRHLKGAAQGPQALIHGRHQVGWQFGGHFGGTGVD